jgi:hypothetical protein
LEFEKVIWFSKVEKVIPMNNIIRLDNKELVRGDNNIARKLCKAVFIERLLAKVDGFIDNRNNYNYIAF